MYFLRIFTRYTLVYTTIWQKESAQLAKLREKTCQNINQREKCKMKHCALHSSRIHQFLSGGFTIVIICRMQMIFQIRHSLWARFLFNFLLELINTHDNNLPRVPYLAQINGAKVFMKLHSNLNLLTITKHFNSKFYNIWKKFTITSKSNPIQVWWLYSCVILNIWILQPV